MDILAHGLWTNITYRLLPATKNSTRVITWGVVFGILPDLISFTPVIVERLYYIIFQNEPAKFIPANFNALKFASFATTSYNFTHSLIIWVVVSLTAWLFFKKFPWILFGWGLHIAVDVFSHSNEFFPTPFLFPFSNFRLSIISWAHPIFMMVNYGLLLIFYSLILPRLRK